MAKGKAYGADRAYQELCRDIIRHLQFQDDLVPYSGDGIDIPFQICGTDVTFDVALKDPQGKLVVVECKRWKYPIKRKEIAAFAFDVECLRKDFEVEVAGIFVTKSRYQSGAIKMATRVGVDVAVCDQNQSPQEFVISYKRYDPQREAIIQNVKAQLTGSIRPSGALSAMVIRVDGSVEELGELKMESDSGSPGP